MNNINFLVVRGCSDKGQVEVVFVWGPLIFKVTFNEAFSHHIFEMFA